MTTGSSRKARTTPAAAPAADPDPKATAETNGPDLKAPADADTTASETPKATDVPPPTPAAPTDPVAAPAASRTAAEKAPAPRAAPLAAPDTSTASAAPLIAPQPPVPANAHEFLGFVVDGDRSETVLDPDDLFDMPANGTVATARHRILSLTRNRGLKTKLRTLAYTRGQEVNRATAAAAIRMAREAAQAAAGTV